MGAAGITVDAAPAAVALDRLSANLDRLAARHAARRVYVWHGRHGRGAMTARREQKRADAEVRNALTLPGRRRAARR